ncbi:hypothetical protein EAO77_35625 [Streptomyces sp. t39]|nr:hypothetical protein EAO77_35625 [Streptomyces sp. t39]
MFQGEALRAAVDGDAGGGERPGGFRGPGALGHQGGEGHRGGEGGGALGQQAVECGGRERHPGGHPAGLHGPADDAGVRVGAGDVDPHRMLAGGEVAVVRELHVRVARLRGRAGADEQPRHEPRGADRGGPQVAPGGHDAPPPFGSDVIRAPRSGRVSRCTSPWADARHRRRRRPRGRRPARSGPAVRPVPLPSRSADPWLPSLCSVVRRAPCPGSRSRGPPSVPVVRCAGPVSPG